MQGEIINDFSNIYFFDSYLNGIKKRHLKSAQNFINTLEINELINNRTEIERKIITFSEENNSQTAPVSCLRCRVSYLITGIYKIYMNKIRKNRDFKPISDQLSREILPLCLQDNGSRIIRLSKKNSNNQYERKYINWGEIRNPQKEHDTKLPFGIKILSDFNFEKSSLSNWVRIKFRSNKDIKEKLNEYGIIPYRIWSYLTTISLLELEHILEFYYGESRPNNYKSLLNSYKTNYYSAKKLFFKKYKRWEGWEPDDEFLKSLKPQQKDTENLKNIYKLSLKFKKEKNYKFIVDKDNKSTDIFNEIEEKENKEIREIIRKIIFKISKETASNYISEIVTQMRQKNIFKDSRKKLIWKLYSEGYTTRGIEKKINEDIKCSWKQPYISKIIREKSLSKQIALKIIPSLEVNFRKMIKAKKVNLDYKEFNNKYLFEELEIYLRKFEDLNEDLRINDNAIIYLSNLFLTKVKEENKNQLQVLIKEALINE